MVTKKKKKEKEIRVQVPGVPKRRAKGFFHVIPKDSQQGKERRLTGHPDNAETETETVLPQKQKNTNPTKQK